MSDRLPPAFGAVFAVLVVVLATAFVGIAIRRFVAALWLLPAWSAQLTGNPRRSRALARCLARSCPRRLLPALWLCEANALLWEGNFTRAIARLDAKVRPANDPSLGVVPLLVELEALLFDGKAEAARRLFDAHSSALRAAREGRADLLAIEGFLAFHEGDLDAAKTLLERALASASAGDPITSGALFFLAAIAFRREDHAEARRLLGRTIREGGQRFTTTWAESEFGEHYSTLPLPPRAPVLRRGPERPLLELARDLRVGLATAAFRVKALRNRPFTQARVARLVALNLLLALGLHLVDLTFGRNIFSIGVLAVLAPVLLFMPGGELALARCDRSARLSVFGAVYAALPLFLVLWFALVRVLDGPLAIAAEVFLGTWALAVYFASTAALVSKRTPLRWLASAIVLVVTWLVPMHIGATTTMFFPDPAWDDEGPSRAKALDANERQNEMAFDQAVRLADAEAKLLPERANFPDLYFVGGAGWADQDVFVRELRSAKTLFDDDFGTEGRSIILANAKTERKLPALANVTLAHTLKAVGRIMNPDEDVLFLFLTSHGSADGLAFEFGERGAFREEVLRPNDLRAMLDAANIQWRVLVISGCESGTFVGPLRSEQSLVFTAASSDRPSYGCADGNAFTDFGRTLFAEELSRNRRFLTAFPHVATTIGEREADDGRLASRPQISEGSRIAAKLAELDQRFAQTPARASVAP